jgi:hypothetical protein
MRFPGSYNRDVPAAVEKLHHLLALSRHHRPPTLCFRILLDTVNLSPVEHEVNPSQPPFWSSDNLIPVGSQNNLLGVLSECQPPHFNESFFE